MQSQKRSLVGSERTSQPPAPLLPISSGPSHGLGHPQLWAVPGSHCLWVKALVPTPDLTPALWLLAMPFSPALGTATLSVTLKMSFLAPLCLAGKYSILTGTPCNTISLTFTSQSGQGCDQRTDLHCAALEHAHNSTLCCSYSHCSSRARQL